MTNEEMLLGQRRRDAAYKRIVEWSDRESKAQAYEEVLRILDRRSAAADAGDVDTGGAVRAALDEVYVEVRTLKESLVLESVS